MTLSFEACRRTWRPPPSLTHIHITESGKIAKTCRVKLVEVTDASWSFLVRYRDRHSETFQSYRYFRHSATILSPQGFMCLFWSACRSCSRKRNSSLPGWSSRFGGFPPVGHQSPGPCGTGSRVSHGPGPWITGDHYSIGQSSVSHSFQNNVEIWAKFSKFIVYTVEHVHTKKKTFRWVALISSNLWKYLTLAFEISADWSKNMWRKILACQEAPFLAEEMFRSTL